MVRQPFDEPLPIRMLNEFAYCPRLFHLMHVEGRWEDNEFTAEGRAVHRRVDDSAGVLPGTGNGSGTSSEEAGGDAPFSIVRSVSLASEVLGIVGKLDLVVATGDEAVPVETKRGHVPNNPERSWEPERVQLMAQALLLREHGYCCTYGFLYFQGSRTRVRIECSEQLEERTRMLIHEARAAAASDSLPPPLEDSPKCRGCSLSGICLPDETGLLRDSSNGTETPRRLYPVRDEALPFYVQEQGAQVGKRGETLTVKAKGEILGTVRLRDVSQLVLCGNVMVTAQAIGLLTDRGIPIVHLSLGHWFHGVTFGMGLRNAYDRQAQFRAAADPERSIEFARGIVGAKIRNQRTFLRRNGTGVESGALAALARAAKDAGKTRSRDELLGVEGAAASRYFGQFARLLKGDAVNEGFDFTKRNRRPPRDPVNAMLSFAYAMLCKELTVAVISEGLDPWWGLYHVPRHGRPALALDLMEEFRPLVADSAVVTVVNTRMVTDRDFVVAASGCAMRPNARKALIQAFEARLAHLVTHPTFGYRLSWRATLRLQVRLFSRWLRGDVPSYVGMVTR